MNPFSFQFWVLIFTVITVLSAAVYDYRTRLIPNVITFTAILAGLLVHGWRNGWNGLSFSLLGLAVGGGLLLIFYLLGGMGAGDVKLLAGVGALIGAEKVFAVFVLTAIAGGLMAIGQMMRHSTLKNIFRRRKNFLHEFFYKEHFSFDDKIADPLKNTLPYGVAIAIGALAAFITQ